MTSRVAQAEPGTYGPATNPTNPVGVSSTPDIGPDEDKSKILDKEMKKKELEFKQKQLQWIQNEISALQQQIQAQVNPANQPGGDTMEELERLEETEQEDLAQQQSVNMQNQMMQQTQQLQQQQQMQRQMQASRWVLPERSNIKIALSNTELECDVAATPRQQASGLQAYKELPIDRGLWFPFTARRTATFHMGDVKFPIDIIFIDDTKISKIVANVRPQQMGSWSAICTDVLEVNGGWCASNGVAVGDIVATPLAGKKRRAENVERLINTSWSAPQDARITSGVEASGNSYDTLRTITTAEGESGFSPEEEAEILQVFPFLKSAQEHRQPDTTDRRQPGEIDTRDPETRFEHNTLPDEFSPFGDGDGGDMDPFDNPNLPNGEDGQSNYGKHFHLQRGYDPVVFRETDHPYAIRPSAQVVKVDSPSPDTELAGLDKYKLASGSLRLFDMHAPDWQDYLPEDVEAEGRNYEKIAVIDDEVISGWIDSLGFNTEAEAKLRKSMFTDEYKELLGDALISSGKAVDFELFDSDLLLYQ